MLAPKSFNSTSSLLLLNVVNHKKKLCPTTARQIARGGIRRLEGTFDTFHYFTKQRFDYSINEQ
jgi:hypothetical protein